MLGVAKRKSSETKKQVMRQAAHDIRSPLTALRMLASIVEETIPSDCQELLKNTIDRINAIADDLLSTSEADLRDDYLDLSPKRTTANQATCVVTEIKSIVAEKRLIASPGIKFILEVCPLSNAMSAMEKDQFDRISSNLINNAIEAVGVHGTVRIKVGSTGSHLFLEIADDGVGIPASFLDSVGKRGITSKKGGNGLGLSHAKATLDAAGGFLKIESVEKEGTSIKLFLPKVG